MNILFNQDRRPHRAARTPHHREHLIGCGLLLSLLLASPSVSEGFRNPPAGAFNLGRAGGRIAHVQDATAVTHNPANLVAATNYQAQAALGLVYMKVAHSSAAPGQSAQTENPWKVLPAAYFATPVLDDKCVFGLGLTSPYGLSVDWNETGSSAFAAPAGALRYTSPHYAELMTLNLNPTVGIKLTESISVGVGLDIMWSRLTLKQFYPWAIFPSSGGTEPDGLLHGEGEGYGHGGNLGFTWKITPRQTVALTYRSQMDVDFDGDTQLSNITPTATAFGVTGRSLFASHLAFPNIVAIGYGLQVTDRLRLETDVEWLQFSRFKRLPINIGNNNILLPATSQSVQENWRDTFTIGIAGDYRLSDNWSVRGGYQYYQSPVPDSTFSTTIPDANQNVLTVGLAYHSGAQAIELGYGADFYDRRNLVGNQNPAFDGKYKITVHLFSLSYQLAF